MPIEIRIRSLRASDPVPLSRGFAAMGWNKPASQFELYLEDQAAGAREVFVAEADGEVAGYLTLVREPTHPAFAEAGLPEIQDLNVIERFRRRGIATALLDAAEAQAAAFAPVIGIRVGLHAGYNAAQRLYVKRGYIPDGRGVAHRGRPVLEGESAPFDNDLLLALTKKLRGRAPR